MPKNDFTTLISLRIENGTLKAVDKFCDKRLYLKRSSAINLALKKVFAYYEDEDIFNFLYLGKGLKSCDTKN